ncbi:MAG TPA: hypothetical protein VD999_06170 [Vitreimonas sp.]|nr:hypothetical protein [Vitreimonas sp.]
MFIEKSPEYDLEFVHAPPLTERQLQSIKNLVNFCEDFVLVDAEGKRVLEAFFESDESELVEDLKKRKLVGLKIGDLAMIGTYRLSDKDQEYEEALSDFAGKKMHVLSGRMDKLHLINIKSGKSLDLIKWLKNIGVARVNLVPSHVKSGYEPLLNRTNCAVVEQNFEGLKPFAPIVLFHEAGHAMQSKWQLLRVHFEQVFGTRHAFRYLARLERQANAFSLIAWREAIKILGIDKSTVLKFEEVKNFLERIMLHFEKETERDNVRLAMSLQSRAELRLTLPLSKKPPAD